jgi:hypothetical protein
VGVGFAIVGAILKPIGLDPATIDAHAINRGGRMSDQEQSGKSGLVFGARNLAARSSTR